MTKQLVAWKQALATDAKKTAEQESSGASYISLRGGAMTYKDEQIKDNKLECIVVANITERTMYDRPYDPDDQGPPDCYAQGLDKGSLKPADNVPKPFSDKCDGCPMAEFGTARVGKGPACKTRRKLMLMPVSGLDNPEDAELATMAIPPTSVKNFSDYAGKVASKTSLPPWAVKTMISVNPHPKKQFEVSFDAVSPIEEDKQLAGIHGLIEQAEKDLMRPYIYETEDNEGGDDAPTIKGQE